MTELYNINDLVQFQNLVKILQSYLLPYFATLLLVGFGIYAWNEFVEKDAEGKDGEWFNFIQSTGRKLALPLIAFLVFPIICLEPTVLVSRMYSELKDVDVALLSYKPVIDKAKNEMKELGYLDEDSYKEFDNYSLAQQVSTVKIFKETEKIKGNIEKRRAVMEAQDEIAGVLASTGEISTWDLVTKGGFSEVVHYILTYVLNLIRQGIEYLFGLAFKFLIYLDLILGMFAVTLAIIPQLRSNIFNWVLDNLALQLWAFVFLAIEWVVGFVSFKTMLSDGGSSIADWVVPILGILAYTYIGVFSAKLVIGRQAQGSGMMQTAGKFGLSMVPMAGGVMAAASGGFMKTPAAGAIGKGVKGLGNLITGNKGNIGEKMGSGSLDNYANHAGLSGSVGKGMGSAVSAIKSGVNFFTPQKEATAMDRVAESLDKLTK